LFFVVVFFTFLSSDEGQGAEWEVVWNSECINV